MSSLILVSLCFLYNIRSIIWKKNVQANDVIEVHFNFFKLFQFKSIHFQQNLQYSWIRNITWNTKIILKYLWKLVLKMFAFKYIFWALWSQIFRYKSSAISMYQTHSIQVINLPFILVLSDWRKYLYWCSWSIIRRNIQEKRERGIASNASLHQTNHPKNYNIFYSG